MICHWRWDMCLKRNMQLVWQRKRKMTSREFLLGEHVNGYDIKIMILYLGLNVNFLPKKSWEAMGSPPLVYPSIQLRMVNQYCICPIGYRKCWSWFGRCEKHYIIWSNRDDGKYESVPSISWHQMVLWKLLNRWFEEQHNEF